MDKSILIQYWDMKEEVKHIRKMIDRLKKEIEKLDRVEDYGTGTRKDGTVGKMHVSGISAAGSKKKTALMSYRLKLEAKEGELLMLMTEAEEYIESIKKSELRTMLRLFCLEGLTYKKTAQHMNEFYPNRGIAYTDENVKKRIQRFFKNVPQCPNDKC